MRRSIAICGWPQVYLVLIFLQSILCGSFDFDSSAQVRDHLKIALSEKITEQEYKQQRFHGDTEQTIRKSSNRLKRSIDLNYPDRLSLFFVFSGSGEAGQVHFRKSINFAKEIVRKVGVSKISVVDSEDSWKQLLYSTSEGVINALDSINCTGEETSVFSALTWVMTRRFHLSKHILADDSGHFLVFILTDGTPNMSETEKFLARYLRRHDVEIYFIVTGNAEENSHSNAASSSCDENVFFLKNYARSAWLFTEITGGKVENNSCPDPGAINNGRREGDCCYVDDVLQISCNEDFDLIGEDEIICLSSGLWSHIRPICKRNTHSAAEVLVASGAKLYCIGLKYKSEKDSLYNIARTSTEKPQVFVLKNYTSLLWPDDEDTVRTRGSARSVAEGLVASGAEIYCIGVKDKTKKDSLFKITTYSTQKPQIFVLKNYTSLSWPDDEVTREIDYSLCGRGPEEDHIPSGRIVGGAFAVEPWPWMAAIYFLPTGLSDPAHAELKCGGSIIAEHFIVTAAHCMYDRDLNVRNARQIIVKLGLLNMKVKTFLQEPEVIDLFIHPSYNPGDIYDYDIALLQLNTPIMFNEHVRSICLPPSELPKESKLYSPNEFVLATGWGHPVATLFGTQFKLTDHLKEVALPIQSAEVCKQSLLKYRLKPEIHYTGRMFCAGGGGNDTCQGDSGGPLMQYEFNEEGRRIWTQVGIVSWGIGCGLPNSYGFYSHISQLRSWIDRTMELGFEVEEEEL